MPRISAFLVAEDLSYRLPDRRTLFHSLTLGFHRERTAVVGPNGSGKSTLVDLLRGAVRPTSGRVRREGRLAHLAQDPPLEEGAILAHLMGIEAPLRALLRLHAGTGTPEDVDRVGGAWDLPEAAARALRRAGLPRLADEALLPGGAMDPGAPPPSLLRPVGTLSGGERTRARLAGLLLQEPDILLLDEPTNHLDGPSREAVRDLLATWEGGVVVATHDRALLRSVDRIVELGPPLPRVVTGDLDRWDTVRRAEEEAARRGVDHARKELTRARRMARETAERQARRNARGARSARASNEPKILLGARKEGSQGTTARLRELGVRKEEVARAGLSRARERVTETGEIRAWTAPVELPARREIFRLEEMVPSTPGGVPLALPLTARWAGPVRVAVTGPNGCGKTTLPVEVLSQGERVRLAFALSLGGDPTPGLLLLDEPTNHLDLPGVEALEALLRGWDGSLVVASHDEDFLEGIGVERCVPPSGPSSAPPGRGRSLGSDSISAERRWSGT
jgi:ATPase subunit of ABC transporter with duplicated ATPase domains